MDGWQLTADADGLIDAADLRRAGVDAHDRRDLVRRGLITALARGWFCLGPVQSAEHRHVLTTKAFLRAHEGRALAAHHSALLMLGLPTYRAELGTVRLSRRTTGAPRTRPGQKLGRVIPQEAQRDDTVHPGLAVVQHGLSAGPLSALVAADAALRLDRVTPAELTTALGWVAGHPGSAKISGFLDLADGRRESPGETRLGHLFQVLHQAVELDDDHLAVDAEVDDGVDTRLGDLELRSDRRPHEVAVCGRARPVREPSDAEPGRGRREAPRGRDP